MKESAYAARPGSLGSLNCFSPAHVAQHYQHMCAHNDSPSITCVECTECRSQRRPEEEADFGAVPPRQSSATQCLPSEVSIPSPAFQQHVGCGCGFLFLLPSSQSGMSSDRTKAMAVTVANPIYDSRHSTAPDGVGSRIPGSQWEHVGVGMTRENPVYSLALSSETDCDIASSHQSCSPPAALTFVRAQSSRALYVAIGLGIVAIVLAGAALTLATRSTQSQSASSGAPDGTPEAASSELLSAAALISAMTSDMFRQEARINRTEKMLDEMSTQNVVMALHLNETQKQLATAVIQHTRMALQINSSMQMLAVASLHQTETAQRLKRTEERLAAVETQRSSLEARLAAVEAKQSSSSARLAAVEAERSSLEARLAAVEANTATPGSGKVIGYGYWGGWDVRKCVDLWGDMYSKYNDGCYCRTGRRFGNFCISK